MTKYEAKYLGAFHGSNAFGHAWEHTDLEYEYRGHRYFVTKSNNGYMDSLKAQHEEEQRKIDELIENEGKPVPEWTYEGSAQEGFDLFWNYVEGKED